jgi:hypothetical protein
LGMEEAPCGWQPGGLCGLNSPPPLLSGSGESTITMSRYGLGVAGGTRCCNAADVHVNGGGGIVDIGGPSAQR